MTDSDPISAIVLSQPVITNSLPSSDQYVKDTVTDSPVPSIVQSQPVITKLLPSNMQVAKDTVTDSDLLPPIIQSQLAFIKSHSSQNWEKVKNNLNARRREKYKFNLSPVNERVKQCYNLNPSLVKARKREVYRLNPSPVKKHI